jgi:hypothetical protein
MIFNFMNFVTITKKGDELMRLMSALHQVMHSMNQGETMFRPSTGRRLWGDLHRYDANLFPNKCTSRNLDRGYDLWGDRRETLGGRRTANIFWYAWLSPLREVRH